MPFWRTRPPLTAKERGKRVQRASLLERLIVGNILASLWLVADLVTLLIVLDFQRYL